MKIIYGEKDEIEISLSPEETIIKFVGKWDILQLKNELLRLIEKSFENEVSELLKAGAYSKYKR